VRIRELLDRCPIKLSVFLTCVAVYIVQDPRERLKLDQILHHPFMQDPASIATTLSGRLQPWVDSGLCLSTSTPSTKTSPTSLKSAPFAPKARTPGLKEAQPVTKVCPLNATRLRPMQHNTCNVHVSRRVMIHSLGILGVSLT